MEKEKQKVQDVEVKPRKKLNPIQYVSYTMGCDPEFFFKVNKRVVGSELFIPPEGLKYTGGLKSKYQFVIDGVQAELNPVPYGCRANLANSMASAFNVLKGNLEAVKRANKAMKKIEVCFDRTVTISASELKKLDPKNQKFGCMPSFNAYDPDAHLRLAEVDPISYRKRSAGGHIHISGTGWPDDSFTIWTKKSPEKLVHLLDIIVGNTCVLMDRDVGNKERRKLYGRAGEYRLPAHGIEYRVPSNFWLEAHPLMSITFGLARMVCSIIASKSNNEEYYKQFLEAVSLEDIQKAINNNDFKLAYKNFKAIEPILMDAFGHCNPGNIPLNNQTIKEFHYFIEKINTKGLKYWFKEDPFEHWCNLPDAHYCGGGDFLTKAVREDMKKSSGTAGKVKAMLKL